MADRHVPGQLLEFMLAEDLADEAHPLAGLDGLAVAGADACALLAAVLQGVQAEVCQVGGLRVAEDRADAALLVEVIPGVHLDSSARGGGGLVAH